MLIVDTRDLLLAAAVLVALQTLGWVDIVGWLQTTVQNLLSSTLLLV